MNTTATTVRVSEYLATPRMDYGDDALVVAMHAADRVDALTRRIGDTLGGDVARRLATHAHRARAAVNTAAHAHRSNADVRVVARQAADASRAAADAVACITAATEPARTRGVSYVATLDGETRYVGEDVGAAVASIAHYVSPRHEATPHGSIAVWIDGERVADAHAYGVHIDERDRAREVGDENMRRTLGDLARVLGSLPGDLAHRAEIDADAAWDAAGAPVPVADAVREVDGLSEHVGGGTVAIVVPLPGGAAYVINEDDTRHAAERGALVASLEAWRDGEDVEHVPTTLAAARVLAARA